MIRSIFMLIAHCVLAPTQQLVFAFHLHLHKSIVAENQTINNVTIFNHQKDDYDGMHMHMESIQTLKRKVS